MLDPLSSLTWAVLGEYFIDAGQFAGAHNAIGRALEILPDSYFARSQLGKLQLLEGKASEAIVTFRKLDMEVFALVGSCER